MEDEEFAPASGRLFVAIELPDYVREALARIRTEAGGPPGIKWIDLDKLHLTLAFLGEVDRDRQIELLARLPEATVKPFYLALEGLGVFPRKGRPQVLWAGLAPVDPCLFQLHQKVEQISLDLRFEPETRRYHPHVTIARCAPTAGPAVTQLMKTNTDFGTAPFRVDGITLFASQLTSRGSIHTRLLRIEF